MNTPHNDNNKFSSYSIESMQEQGEKIIKKINSTTKMLILGIILSGGGYYIGQKSTFNSDAIYERIINDLLSSEAIQNEKNLIEQDLNAPVITMIYSDKFNPENGFKYAFIPFNSANNFLFNTDTIENINGSKLSTEQIKKIHDLPGNHNSLYERSILGFSYNQGAQHEITIWRNRTDTISDADDWVISDNSSINKPDQGKFQVVGTSFKGDNYFFRYTENNGFTTIINSEEGKQITNKTTGFVNSLQQYISPNTHDNSN